MKRALAAILVAAALLAALWRLATREPATTATTSAAASTETPTPADPELASAQAAPARSALPTEPEPPRAKTRGPRRAIAPAETPAPIVEGPPLDVLVVDADGAPAEDVRLDLRQLGLARGSEVTDREGRASFDGAGELLARADPSLVLRVGLPLADDVDVVVEPAPPPGEPFVVRLSPLGSLEARVLDADGAPADEADVVLEWPGSEASWASAVPRTARGGVAVFERVGLRQEFELSAVSGDSGARERVDGPSAPGERVVVELRLARERTRVRLRAVDGSGAPIAARLEVTTRVQTGQGSNGSTDRAKSDADGWFEAPVLLWLGVGSRTLEVQTSDGALSGSVDLARSLPPGLVELGEIVLAPRAVAAAGRVLDDVGAPVHGADVRWNAPRDSDGGTIERDRARTDERGEFVLFGAGAPPRIVVSASHQSLHFVPLEVARGATGIELLGRAFGGLAGALLLEPDVSRESFSVSIRREAGPDGSAPAAEDQSAFSGHWREGASFENPKLPPGTYSLAVRAGEERLFEAGGLAVLPGETCRDPRIQAIDLRGLRLRALRLLLVTPRPGAEINGEVWYGAAGSAEKEHRVNATEVVTLVTPLERVDATVRVAGYRVERLTDLQALTEVRLRPGPAVRLVLPRELELPAPRLHLAVWLSGEDGARSVSAYFDERGEATLRAGAPGRATLHWSYQHRDRFSSSGGQLELPERTIEIAEQDAEQRIELHLTQAELDAALQAR